MSSTVTESAQRFQLGLTLQDGYAFAVNFDTPGISPITIDEAPPLGAGTGPNPARVLGAAIGSCLGASLLFCLRKSRVNMNGLQVNVTGTLVRNERGRLRIGAIKVHLAPDLPVEARERLPHCLDLFEDFCIVTESVRAGIPVAVEVEGASADTRQLISR